MSGDGYTVEARVETGDPIKVGDFVVTHEWKRVPFVPACQGIPVFNGYLVYTGYLSYTAAQALRWWFHANAERDRMLSNLMMVTRIVKHKISVNHSVEAVSVHMEIGGEDRSGLMPDWGKKDPT